jgi:hypothetical protein
MSDKPKRKMSEEQKKKLSEVHKAIWADPEKRAQRTKKFRESWHKGDRTVARATFSNNLKSKWDDPEFREKMKRAQSEGAKKRWADPEKRAALIQTQKGSHKKNSDRDE